MQRKPILLEGPGDIPISARDTPAFYHLLKEALLRELGRQGLLKEEELSQCMELLKESPRPPEKAAYYGCLFFFYINVPKAPGKPLPPGRQERGLFPRKVPSPP